MPKQYVRPKGGRSARHRNGSLDKNVPLESLMTDNVMWKALRIRCITKFRGLETSDEERRKIVRRFGASSLDGLSLPQLRALEAYLWGVILEIREERSYWMKVLGLDEEGVE